MHYIHLDIPRTLMLLTVVRLTSPLSVAMVTVVSTTVVPQPPPLLVDVADDVLSALVVIAMHRLLLPWAKSWINSALLELVDPTATQVRVWRSKVQ